MASIPRDYPGRNFHQSESEGGIEIHDIEVTDSEANSIEDDDDDNVIIHHQGNLGFDVDSDDEFGAGFAPSWIHQEAYQEHAIGKFCVDLSEYYSIFKIIYFDIWESFLGQQANLTIR